MPDTVQHEYRIKSLENDNERLIGLTERLTDLVSEMKIVFHTNEVRMKQFENTVAEISGVLKDFRSTSDTRISEVITKMNSEFKDVKKEFAEENDKLYSRIEKLDKLYWISIGACSIIGFILARINLSTLF